MSTTSGSGTPPLDPYSAAVVAVVERVGPAVANLQVMRRTSQGRRRTGAGSGVVIAPDGYLLTSAHVVERANGGVASFDDGRELDFAIVGADPLSDLAVLRSGEGDLPAATLGDAQRLRVGQLVVAIGNPHGFASSVTAGVVSGLGRSLPVGGRRGPHRVVENVIQTDAALNPGNSGGALADAEGRIVGINTALAGIGLGLAVPVNEATRAIVATLMRDGRVRRAQLGVAVAPRPLPRGSREGGVEVVGVVEGGAADRAGIRAGDVLLDLDGHAIGDATALQRLMSAERIGRELEAEILRGQRRMTIRVTPTELG
jgi:S1-C subfamily serine protease